MTDKAKNMTKKVARYLIISIVAVIVYNFFSNGIFHKGVSSSRDYPEIVAGGTIYATTELNTISMHIQGDTLSGFYYELISAFSRFHNLQLDITPEMSVSKQLEGLTEGKFDIVADGIPITSEHPEDITFTCPIITGHQILVQRKPSEEDDTTSVFINSLLDLAGKTVYIANGSPAEMRIRHLTEEIGDTIYVRNIANYGPEQLIALVAHGDIDYVVCDKDIADNMSDNLPQIDTSVAIGFNQHYGWAVNSKSTILLDSLNVWIESYKKSKDYKRLYKKYFR